MIWFIASLIPLTALMMGAVLPWAYKALEEAVLAIVMTWIVCVVLGRCSLPVIDRKLRLPLGGMILFFLIVAFQLVPLPVQIERVISPSTYRLYQIGLPGWPERAPYSWLLDGKSSDEGTTNEHRKPDGQLGTKRSINLVGERLVQVNPERNDSLHFPISVAPSLTKVALFKSVSCFLLGLLIVLYPFPNGASGSSSTYQTLFKMLLATGLLLGLEGLLQEFISNGKPLWIFTPYTFRSPDMWGMRAFGSFANPDHYGCFLAMLLPPALAGIIFPTVLGRVRERAAVPLLSGAVTVVIIAALLATASRAGMLNAMVGVAVLGWLSSRLPPERLPELFQIKKRKHLILAVGAAGLLALAVYLAGSSNQAVAGARLEALFSGESITKRLVPAEDSVRMIADFPVFGVGLGAWPDLYRVYTRPPWSTVFMNAAHDEYVQVLAETGAVGFLILAVVIFGIWHQASSNMLDLPRNIFAIVASFVASLAGLATHAALDFPLRVPAIAVLATIMCGFVSRAVFPEQIKRKIDCKPSTKHIFGALGLITGLLALMWIVALQPHAPYPYDLKTPQNSTQMVQLLLAHPVNSRVHMMLMGFVNTNLTQDRALEELASIVALEPNNPIARDMYLQTLARQGHNETALDQMSESVFRAPTSTDHFYMNSSWVPKLTAAERDAIDRGLHAAVKHGFDGALTTLADYYETLGKFRREAYLLTDSARSSRDSKQKAKLLSRAGRSLAKAGDYDQAVSMLHEAIRLSPEEVTAYEYLSLDVNVPRRQFENARLALNQGIEAGADPATLYLKLAKVNQAAKDKSGEEEALKQAADLQPLNFEISYSLGDVYFSDGRLDEAVLWLRKATEANPSSAEAYFELAQAEEAAYQFSAAHSDYSKALALAPDNVNMQSRFQQFKARVAASSSRPD